MKKTHFITETALSCAFVIICSFISVPSGLVPITLQTFAIMCIAGIFGMKIGVLSVLLYILAGAVGLPVFHSGQSGLGIIFGPTGGYLVGFIGIAVMAGLQNKNSSFSSFVLYSFIGHVICYVLGTVWFAVFYGSFEGLWGIMTACVLPFIIPDAIKIILSSLFVKKLKYAIYKNNTDANK